MALRRGAIAPARRNLIFRHELGGVLRAFAEARIPVLGAEGRGARRNGVLEHRRPADGGSRPVVHRRDPAARSRRWRPAAIRRADRVETAAGGVDTAFECESILYKTASSRRRSSCTGACSIRHTISTRCRWTGSGTAEPVRSPTPRPHARPASAGAPSVRAPRLHHGGDELLWLHDIAQLVTAWGARIDWAVVLDAGAAPRPGDLLRDVLGRAAVDWGAPIPSAVLTSCRRCAVAARSARRALAQRAEPQCRPVASGSTCHMPSWPRRVAFAWTTCCRPSPTCASAIPFAIRCSCRSTIRIAGCGRCAERADVTPTTASRRPTGCSTSTSASCGPIASCSISSSGAT